MFPDGRQQALDFGDEPHDLELGANPEWDTTSLRLSYQSLTTPASVYDVDVVTGERILRKQTPTPNVDLDRYVSMRTWAKASDGTAVPVDVVRHVDTPLDGTAPGVVYAYGSYEISMPPWFSVMRLSLLDRGVVWVLVHPRGGGELGRRWYLDGKLLNKRNTFTDMLAATEHVVAERFVDPAARRHPRRQRRRAPRRRVHHDAPRAVPRRGRRGAVRRRRDDDERRHVAADLERVGGVGRPSGRAVRQLHAELLAVRQHRPGRVPGASTSRRGSTIRASATTSRPSGSPGCGPSAPGASGCC